MKYVFIFSIYCFALSSFAGLNLLNTTVSKLDEALFKIGEAPKQFIAKKEFSLLIWNIHKEGYQNAIEKRI